MCASASFVRSYRAFDSDYRAGSVVETVLRTTHIATSQGTHNHDHPQILIGHQGVMQCELPNCTGAIARGAFGVLPSSVEHRYRGGSEQCRLLVIDLDTQDPFIKALEDVCRTPVWPGLFDQAELLSPTSSMLTLLDWADIQFRQSQLQSTPAFQYQMISVFLTQLMMHGSSTPLALSPPHRLDVRRLDEFIDKNIYRAIDNEELASLCHISSSHLYVLMRQYSGLSPQRYVAGRRMIRARALIETHKAALGQIAEMVGFSDGASFSRAYRRHFGHAPSTTSK